MRSLKIVAWSVITLSALAVILLLFYSYADFLTLVLKITHYNKPEKIAALLTPRKFLIIKLSPLTGVLVGWVVLIFKGPIARELYKFMNYSIQTFRLFIASIRAYSKEETILLAVLLAINLIVKFYLAITLPLTYDEAWTFLNFTEKGIASSISYYPAPNNHIFFSVLTNISSHLPLSYHMMVRVPSVLGNCLFLFLLYAFCRRLYNYKIAITMATIVSFLYPVFYYGFTARGYSYILLFFLINYYSIISLLMDPNQAARYLFVFSISSVLGFYTMPAFLYPYITINIFLAAWALFTRRWNLFKYMVLWGIVTGACVLILYTPIFIVSGIKAVTSNSYVSPIPRALIIPNLLPHFLLTYNTFFYFLYSLPLAVVIVLLAFIDRPYQFVALFNLWIISFSFVIPILHSVIPFPRNWVYLIIPVIFSFGNVLNYFLSSRVKLTVLVPCLIILVIEETQHSTFMTYKEVKFALEAKQMNKYLIDHNLNVIYTDEPLTDVFVLYAYTEKKKPLKCFIKLSDIEDTTNKIDALILKKNSKNITAKFQPAYYNDFVTIYTRHN